MEHCCLKKCLWNLRGDRLSCLNSNCLGQILLIMLSVNIDPINGAVPVTARQGNALLPLLKLQWVCYGVSYIQKEKTCRYVHTHLFMTMQFCVCVCVGVWFKKYSNHLCVRKSSQNLNAFSLFVLCLFVIVFCCVVYLPSERYLLFRLNASEAWSFLPYTEDKKNWKGKISIFVLFSVINLCSYELKICHRHVLCLLFW